eukprot:scaffold298208_cov33-Tisochrysis_lutea.AAC.4
MGRGHAPSPFFRPTLMGGGGDRSPALAPPFGSGRGASPHPPKAPSLRALGLELCTPWSCGGFNIMKKYKEGGGRGCMDKIPHAGKCRRKTGGESTEGRIESRREATALRIHGRPRLDHSKGT